MRVEVQNLKGERRVGEWKEFSVGDKNSKYVVVQDYSVANLALLLQDLFLSKAIFYEKH